MARPKLSPTEQKAHRIVFRLTQKEMLPLTLKAAALDLSVNELARELTLTKVDTLILKAEKKANPALIKQIYYIGHNLNQLVKNAHIFGRVSPRIEHLCERIEKLMDQALEEDAP